MADGRFNVNRKRWEIASTSYRATTRRDLQYRKAPFPLTLPSPQGEGEASGRSDGQCKSEAVGICNMKAQFSLTLPSPQGEGEPAADQKKASTGGAGV